MPNFSASRPKARIFAPPALTTYASRLGQIALALAWLVMFFAPYAFSRFAPSDGDDFAPPAIFGALTGQSLFCALTALMAFLVALLPRPRAEYSQIAKIAMLAFAAFLLWTAAAIFVASYKFDAYLEAVRVLSIGAWFFFLRALLTAEIDAEDERPRVLISRAAALVMAACAGSALVSALAIYGFTQQGGRQASTFYNNNLLANYCAMAAPLCLAMALHGWRKLRFNSHHNSASANNAMPQIIFSLLCFILTLGGVFATSSKGGFLALLASLLAFALCIVGARRAAVSQFARARRVLVLGLAAAFVVGGGFVAMKTVVPRLAAARTTDDNSTMFRAYTWRGTLNMATQKPLLGWGTGAFPSTYSTRFGETGYTRSAHQSWLQIAAECGFPALAFLFVSFGAALLCALKNLRGFSWDMAAGALAALVALLVHGFVDSGWNITSIALLAVAMMAFTTTFNSVSTQETQESRGSLRWEYLAATLAIAGAAFWMQRVVSAEDIVRADRDNIAQEKALDGGIDGALQRSAQAIDANPLAAPLYMHRANLLQAAGRDAFTTYLDAARLRPQNSKGWEVLAQHLAAQGQKEMPEELFARAEKLDPKNTELLLDYANFRLKNGDARGYDLLQRIVALREAPYGRYPALGDFINLDFARAALKLAPREKDKQRRAALLHMASRDIKAAREKQAYVESLVASGAGGVLSAPKDLGELESELQKLQPQP